MLFLIEYARSEGKVVKLNSFTDSERAEAQKQKFDIELSLNRSGIEHEVVLLDAIDEDAIRRTHRRYFQDLSQIAESMNGKS
jgi:hypothetical protein